MSSRVNASGHWFRRAHRLLLAASLSCAACTGNELPSADKEARAYDVPAFQLKSARVSYDRELDSLIFEARVHGDAASVAPTPVGKLHGAPVLGYVFTTNLAPSSVGFPDDEGTLALAVTSHPDFDDSPLWDEDGNETFDDDGRVYHTHWVVLVPDKKAPGGLAVRQASHAQQKLMPPTAPMPMFMDSPGFTVLEQGDRLRVLVPFDRVSRNADFQVDVVTALMKVDTQSHHPALRVHALFDDLPGDLPLSVEGAKQAPKRAWPEPGDDAQSFQLEGATVSYQPDLDLLVFSLDTLGQAATVVPQAVGALDGAPVLGYVFPTSVSPSAAGFGDAKGTLALAVASHPDFDDSPLWDENLDRKYDNDGATYHVHWVVLQDDAASPAKLSVPATDEHAVLPKTAPMHMLMDSPGFHAFASGKRLRVLVPAARLRGQTQFKFDAVTARMQVDASSGHGVLRVHEVFDVLSGDLSLPFSVTIAADH